MEQNRDTAIDARTMIETFEGLFSSNQIGVKAFELLLLFNQSTGFSITKFGRGEFQCDYLIVASSTTAGEDAGPPYVAFKEGISRGAAGGDAALLILRSRERLLRGGSNTAVRRYSRQLQRRSRIRTRSCPRNFWISSFDILKLF